MNAGIFLALRYKRDLHLGRWPAVTFIALGNLPVSAIFRPGGLPLARLAARRLTLLLLLLLLLLLPLRTRPLSLARPLTPTGFG
jgi:hypothetical protein